MLSPMSYAELRMPVDVSSAPRSSGPVVGGGLGGVTYICDHGGGGVEVYAGVGSGAIEVGGAVRVCTGLVYSVSGGASC